MDNVINILIGSDINYAPYYGVMLTSLFMNNKKYRFDVYLMTDETWTNQLTNKFDKICKQNNSKFIPIICDSQRVMKLPLATHINSSAYYHLQAATLLPKEVHKILYLDGDMIINGDIWDLWNVDLTDKAYAGSEDCCYYDEEMYERMQFDKTHGYVNNGVMLYNVDYLRQTNFPERSLEYVETYPERIKWMDQDIDNILLANGKVSIPLKFNFQTLLFLKFHWAHYDEAFRKQVLDAAQAPIIIHYSGRIKPWHFKYKGLPYEDVWNKYYKASPWRFIRQRRPFSKYIKYLVKCLFLKNMFRKSRDELYIIESATY